MGMDRELETRKSDVVIFFKLGRGRWKEKQYILRLIFAFTSTLIYRER